MSGSRTLPSAGIAASSATRAKSSVAIFPCLTSGIDTLPEWFDAQTLDGVDEQLFRPLAQREIGLDNVLHHIGNIAVWNGRSDQVAEFGILVRPAADGDLVKFLAVLLDAENADMADMVVATGVDAAGNVDVQLADQVGGLVIGETPGDLLSNVARAPRAAP